ncbi:MAG: DUF3466 family protein [Candidatus Auribacter fodinae]|jgi:probable HAF family extracellular repeat protein|uniref:DUF3466 family protein n=1 Tax=Candidatus Auribacter fodinae TaxID=2093366 RepID=A0A3A4RIK2_9BACT|nr:MAG: DUF3466 family protein [Candidatus Auribacter fodinae]
MRKKFLCTVASVVLSAASLSYAAEYEVEEIGTLDGYMGSAAYAINNKGEVAGELYGSSNFRAMLWQNGVITPLGTLGGTNSSAYDINNNTQITGFAENSNDEERAYIWSGGTMSDLGDMPASDPATPGERLEANKINNSGVIVGYGEVLYPWHTEMTVPTQRAFKWDGTMHNLGLVPGYEVLPDDTTVDEGTVNGSVATAINNNGVIIGYAQIEKYEHMFDYIDTIPVAGFVYDDGMMQVLDSPMDYAVMPLDINDAGQIVGVAVDMTTYELSVVLWENATSEMQVIITPENAYILSLAININGDIVGTDDDSGTPYLWEKVWDEETSSYVYKYTDLNDLLPAASDWLLYDVYDINDAGQMVGGGSFAEGDYMGYVMTPSITEIAVPEPMSLVLIGLGTIGIIIKRFRK